MRRTVFCLALLTLFGTPVTLSAQAAAVTSELLRELNFRPIGPAVTGGRIHDVEALPHDPSTIYLATASGGIWKSTNKGTTWTPIFDHQSPINNLLGDRSRQPQWTWQLQTMRSYDFDNSPL